MIRRPPRSTRTDTLFPTRRSSDLRRFQPQRAGHAGGRGDGEPGRMDEGEQLQQVQPRKRSEEHTSELQSLMRISYAVFCLKKKKKEDKRKKTHNNNENNPPQ